MVWLVLLMACGHSKDCPSLAPGMERDVCFHDQALALPPAQAAQVLALVSQIQDPIVRGAAVFTWTTEHGRELTPQQGQPLCDLLDSREKTSCTRKLSAVHLRR